MKNLSCSENGSPAPSPPLASRRQVIGSALAAGGASLLTASAPLLAAQAAAPAPGRATSRRISGIIDVHAHALFGFGARPPVDKPPAWSVAQALDAMDENGIAASVLSVPFAANEAEGAEASDIARRTNARLAEIVAAHPTRFGALATVPGRDMGGAIREMAYALDVLGLDGVSTSTSIGDVYLGDPRYEPWFDEMNQRRVTLFVHPVAAKASRPVDLGIDVSILEFMFDTTRMLTSMVFSGAKKRFSDIKIISTHGGGTVPYLGARIQILERQYGTGAGRPPITSEQIAQGFGSFYYDLTASTCPAQLHALRQWVPASQLLLGFDNPFMPKETVAPAIGEVTAWPGFSNADLALVSRGNAATLFPKMALRIGRQE